MQEHWREGESGDGKQILREGMKRNYKRKVYLLDNSYLLITRTISLLISKVFHTCIPPALVLGALLE